MASPVKPLHHLLGKLSEEAFEYYLNSEVPVLDELPDELEFYRSYVAANRPVIVRNAINHWPALTKWNADYFKNKFGAKELTVTVTPNGYADAVTDGYFVQPEEKQWTMADFLEQLERAPEGRVLYVQRQNSNLTDELPELIGDCQCDIPWASRLFGSKPDAVNFWMGDARAVTSMHKDPYENIYCVVSGYKDFILHPPTDQPWIPYGEYPQGRWKEVDGSFQIVPESGTVPWIAIDPLSPDYERFPEYRKATQVKCRVKAGEFLYLPSLWFHHVRQSHGCIAVNYWYDMQYDIKYNYFELVKGVKNVMDKIS